MPWAQTMATLLGIQAAGDRTHGKINGNVLECAPSRKPGTVDAPRWTGRHGMAEELTLSMDSLTGEYTRLTRFLPGADTAPFGGKMHPYPEEVFIVSGRLYDQAFDLWLEAGGYASRPPGELHGPFRTNEGCVVLEVSFPQRVAAGDSASPALLRETPRSTNKT